MLPETNDSYPFSKVITKFNRFWKVVNMYKTQYIKQYFIFRKKKFKTLSFFNFKNRQTLRANLS